MSRDATVPVSSRMRSDSVDLPWSMCAMMEKLRRGWGLSWLLSRNDVFRWRPARTRRRCRTGGPGRRTCAGQGVPDARRRAGRPGAYCTVKRAGAPQVYRTARFGAGGNARRRAPPGAEGEGGGSAGFPAARGGPLACDGAGGSRMTRWTGPPPGAGMEKAPACGAFPLLICGRTDAAPAVARATRRPLRRLRPRRQQRPRLRPWRLPRPPWPCASSRRPLP